MDEQTDNLVSQKVTQPARPGGKQIAQSMIWMTAANYGGYAINLIIGMVLARILSPADFGIFGLAASMALTLGTLASWGVEVQIFTRYREGDEQLLNQIFTVILALNMSVFGVVGIVAWLWHFSQPVVVQVLVVLGILQVLVVLGQIPRYLFEKKMNFRPIAITQFLSVVAESGVALGCALMGWRYWSLLAGRIAGSLSQIVIFLIIGSWRPRIILNKEYLREVYDYGKGFFVTNNLSGMQNRFDDLMVGVLINETALGIYSRSFLLSETIGQLIAPGLGQAMLSTFSALRDDPAEVKRIFELVNWVVFRLMIGYAMPVAVLAPQLVLIVFGDQWLAVTPILRLLLIYGSLVPIMRIIWMLLVAYEKQEEVARISIYQTIFFMVAVVIFTLVGGAKWTALVVDLVIILQIILMLRAARRLAPVTLWEGLLPGLVAGGIAGGITWGIVTFLLVDFPALVIVAIGGMVSLLLYGMLLYLLERRKIGTQLDLFFDATGLQDSRLARFIMQWVR